MIPPLRSHPSARDAIQRRRPRAGVTALILAATLGLAGCTQPDKTPEAEPTATGAAATPSPTPTPSPTRSAQPERPAAMADATVDGALAFATYFASLYPYVYNTGDLTEWKELSHPECKFCASVVTGVEEMHGAGLHNEGAQLAITESTALEIDPGRTFSADLEVTREPSKVADASGSPVGDVSPAASFRIVFALLFEEGTWRVRGVETVMPGG